MSILKTCEVCNSFYNIYTEDRGALHSPRVCSGDCFRELLLDNGKGLYPITEVIDKFDDLNWNERKNVFKSQLEKEFAERLQDLNMAYYYEPIVYNKEYIPDFFIRDANAFIEVKGLWQPGAIRKVQSLKDYLGTLTPVYIVDRQLIRRLYKCNVHSAGKNLLTTYRKQEEGKD